MRFMNKVPLIAAGLQRIKNWQLTVIDELGFYLLNSL